MLTRASLRQQIDEHYSPHPSSIFLKVLFRECKHVGALTDKDLQNYYGATATSHFHVYTNF